jgi:hypothetical protein
MLTAEPIAPKAARLAAGRLTNERLLHYAEFLPELPRTLLIAHLERGMKTADLALLHNVTPRQMSRRLSRLREHLADPCFLLTATYGRKLPEHLAPLARGFWIEGLTLRQLATQHHHTLHRIRQHIALARSLLLIHVSAKHPLTSEQAYTALCGEKNSPQRHRVHRECTEELKPPMHADGRR